MPTQQQIADHLDLDQSAVSRLLEKLGVAWQTADMDEIRKAYIRQLRAQAAGHKSEDGLDLVRERVLTERVDRELKLLQVAEKRGVVLGMRTGSFINRPPHCRRGSDRGSAPSRSA